MSPAPFVVAAIAVALLAAAVAWRARARRRRRWRDPARAPERRLVTPPPSPYLSSRGFRLVDAETEPTARPPAQLPRLETNRTYVFGESLPPEEDVVNSDARHSNDWFLSRSAHRTPLSFFARRLVVMVVVALVLAVVVTYYFDHRSARAHSPGAPRAFAVTDSSLVALRLVAPPPRLHPRGRIVAAAPWVVVSVSNRARVGGGRRGPSDATYRVAPPHH